MRRSLSRLGVLAGLALAAAGARAEPAAVVVELYTSQGCSSCPPADRLLGELKQRDGVLALSQQVTYWDYLGWEDPYALSRHDTRQERYARALGSDRVYTPQMVMNGRAEAVGSRRAAVDAAIDRARRAGGQVTPRIAGEGGSAEAVVPMGDGGPATVWRVTYDARHATSVGRGENAGARVVNHNVVRDWRKLGTWTGDRLTRALDLSAARANGRDGVAVLVQRPEDRAILGAAYRRLNGG